MTIPGAWYLILSGLLFTIGAVGVLVRRNVLVMFMCVELMLNAVNLTFITFSRMLGDIGGQAVCSSYWSWRQPRSWSASGSSWPSTDGGSGPPPTTSMC